jgi:hypothetical protein
MTHDQYRFYSFVAGLYLSPLQQGLQTAHVVSETYANLYEGSTANEHAFANWARYDKTIIICNAYNSAGVIEAHVKIKDYASKLGLPFSIFHEDEQSLNGAPTATGVVVPRCFYAAQKVHLEPRSFISKITRGIFSSTTDRKKPAPAYMYEDETGLMTDYAHGSPEAEFIKFLKSYKLA